jgi:hypothetical protein
MPIPIVLRHLIHVDDATFDMAPRVIQEAHIKYAHHQLREYTQSLHNFYNHLVTLPNAATLALKYVKTSPVFGEVLAAAPILHRDILQCLHNIIYISGTVIDSSMSL